MLKALKGINLPTKITLARIAMLPVILFFYCMAVCTDVVFFVDWGKLIAALLFVLAAATDWLDGFIARKYNMVTNTGKLLDPVADKMLTLIGFVMILADPTWYENYGGSTFVSVTPAGLYWLMTAAVFIALGRDVLMNSLRFIAAEQGITIAADKLGKIKSTLQYVAITLYIVLAFLLNPLNEALNPIHSDSAKIFIDIWAYACVFTLAAATVLSIWSCANYIINYSKGLRAKGITFNGTAYPQEPPVEDKGEVIDGSSN